MKINFIASQDVGTPEKLFIVDKGVKMLEQMVAS